MAIATVNPFTNKTVKSITEDMPGTIEETKPKETSRGRGRCAWWRPGRLRHDVEDCRRITSGPHRVQLQGPLEVGVLEQFQVIGRGFVSVELLDQLQRLLVAAFSACPLDARFGIAGVR